jgi:hypothetical protein
MKGTAVKTLWIYVHACLASLAWIFILLAWSVALLDPRSGINQDPVFATISILVALGHLSAGSYLVRRIRDDIREARRASANTVSGERTKDRCMQPSS